MCIVFLAISSQPRKDGFKVIVANNRDELFNRPTREAHFWEDHPDIISGTDLSHGCEGGTWLGMTKTGKIGILTNYRQASSFTDTEKKSRGDLVTGFLKSNLKAQHYIEQVKEKGKDYNGFNLIVGDVSSEGSSEFSYYCNQEHEPLEDLKPGVYCLSNRYLDYGWKKVSFGKQKFTEIIHKECPIDEKIPRILELLQDTTRYPEDDLFIGPQDVGMPKPFLNALTAISVFIPVKYGTRTNTIIVIDKDDDVTYIERTMEGQSMEVSSKMDDIHWKTSKFNFKIHS